MKEAIKKFILDKSKEVFMDLGYKDASMNLIANTCKISKPTLYNYYPSKKELFHEVLKTIHSELEQHIFHPVTLEPGFKNQLKMLIKKSLEFTQNNKRLIWVFFFEASLLMIHESIKDGKNLQKTITQKTQFFIQQKENRIKMIKYLLKRGIKEGTLKEDIDINLTSLSILGILREFLFYSIFNTKNLKNTDEISVKLFNIISTGILKERI